jgi:hypothetical protein
MAQPGAAEVLGYPDLAASPNNEYLCITWANMEAFKIYVKGIEISGQTYPAYSADITYSGDTPRASVLFRDNDNVYLHINGYQTGSGGSGTSNLFYGPYQANLINPYYHVAQVDLPDAQMAISDAGNVGFCTAAASGAFKDTIKFNYYNPSTQSMAGEETIASNLATQAIPLKFNYGLTFRGDQWHAIYYDYVTAPGSHYVARQDGSGQLWNELYIGDGVPDYATDYYCCQNTANPPGIDESFWGFIALDVADTTPYAYWFRYSGDVLPPPIPEQNYWESGNLTGGSTVDVSTENYQLARRGTGEEQEFLRFMDHVLLSDGTLIFTDSSSIYAFGKDVGNYGSAPIAMRWTSGEFPGDNLWQSCVEVKVTYESDVNFTLTIYNESGSSKSILLQGGTPPPDSGKTWFISLNGRRFYFTIDSTGDTKIRRVQFRLLKTQSN